MSKFQCVIKNWVFGDGAHSQKLKLLFYNLQDLSSETHLKHGVAHICISSTVGQGEGAHREIPGTTTQPDQLNAKHQAQCEILSQNVRWERPMRTSDVSLWPVPEYMQTRTSTQKNLRYYNTHNISYVSDNL